MFKLHTAKREWSGQFEVNLINTISVQRQLLTGLPTVVATTVLENEIVTAMRLLGVTSLEQVNPNIVECLQELWK
jgi:hypothetical protein